MYTYLIIDDEELIRKGTIKKLSPLSETVSCAGEAEDGRDGIKKIEQLSPDFVILDMQMPGMDGMELLPYLAEHYPSLPLIVISGYRNFDYVKTAISANAIEYLLKPFHRDDIQKCVRDVITRLESRSDTISRLDNSEREKEQACLDYDLQLLNNLIAGYQVKNISLTSQKLNFIDSCNYILCLYIL